MPARIINRLLKRFKGKHNPKKEREIQEQIIEEFDSIQGVLEGMEGFEKKYARIVRVKQGRKDAIFMRKRMYYRALKKLTPILDSLEWHIAELKKEEAKAKIMPLKKPLSALGEHLLGVLQKYKKAHLEKLPAVPNQVILIEMAKINTYGKEGERLAEKFDAAYRQVLEVVMLGRAIEGRREDKKSPGFRKFFRRDARRQRRLRRIAVEKAARSINRQRDAA